MKKYGVWRVVKGVTFVLVMCVVLGFVVKGLWNALMPGIFGGPQITYWQALGLLVLSKILFGGFHHHGHGGGGGGRWKKQMQERWAQMSDEEREKFRAGMGGRRGWCNRPPVEPRV